PYSCAAWIHSIHRGIDVARAAGLEHLAASTGSTSEKAVQRLFGLPEIALIDMGDFVGGTLKYLRRHKVARLTLAGGFAKLAKLAEWRWRRLPAASPSMLQSSTGRESSSPMRDPEPARHLLILGGTGEAAALASAALSRFGERLRITNSLAGRTSHRAVLAGELRIGGFGGA